ncbi:hypothetical protein ES705_06178 [subsurface metagenome]|nr:hypothetical protein [Clostridia bacterium]
MKIQVENVTLVLLLAILVALLLIFHVQRYEVFAVKGFGTFRVDKLTGKRWILHEGKFKVLGKSSRLRDK